MDEVGVATNRSYCYACPDPIEVGMQWRRERVGWEVPWRFREVHHPICPRDKCKYRLRRARFMGWLVVYCRKEGHDHGEQVPLMPSFRSGDLLVDADALYEMMIGATKP